MHACMQTGKKNALVYKLLCRCTKKKLNLIIPNNPETVTEMLFSHLPSLFKSPLHLNLLCTPDLKLNSVECWRSNKTQQSQWPTFTFHNSAKPFQPKLANLIWLKTSPPPFIRAIITESSQSNRKPYVIWIIQHLSSSVNMLTHTAFSYICPQSTPSIKPKCSLLNVHTHTMHTHTQNSYLSSVFVYIWDLYRFPLISSHHCGSLITPFINSHQLCARV